MAQLPLIRQNQAGNAHIDGATPSYLPTSINQKTNLTKICHIDQSYPKTGGSCAIYVRKRTTLMSFLVVLPSVLGISLIDVDPRWHFPFKMVGLGPPINQILWFCFCRGGTPFCKKRPVYTHPTSLYMRTRSYASVRHLHFVEDLEYHFVDG